MRAVRCLAGRSGLPICAFADSKKKMRLGQRHVLHAKAANRYLIVGALLAMLAMLNVLGLNAWHSSMAGHDETRIESALVQHDDDSPSMPEVDLHKATHTVIHGLADIVPSTGMTATFFAVSGDWFVSKDFVISGLLPEVLLRPPRG